LHKPDKSALVFVCEDSKFSEHSPFSAEKNHLGLTVRESLERSAKGLSCLVADFPRQVNIGHDPFQFPERQIVKDPTGDTEGGVRITE
jgi:hypothetical protein